jgi:hypothetical protein
MTSKGYTRVRDIGYLTGNNSDIMELHFVGVFNLDSINCKSCSFKPGIIVGNAVNGKYIYRGISV